MADGLRSALLVNLLTEDNLPHYFRAIDQIFGADGPWGEWSRRWTAEEGRHSIVIRDYLTRHAVRRSGRARAGPDGAGDQPAGSAAPGDRRQPGLHVAPGARHARSATATPAASSTTSTAAG